jgi:hypothetical protein
MPAWVLPVALTVGSALLSQFLPDKQKKLAEEVLQEQLDFSKQLKRIGRGEFTPEEVSATSRGYAPVMNQISGSLAARGISRSAAVGPVLAAARQAPFLAQQQAAMGGLPGALAGGAAQANFLSSQEQAGNAGFFQSLNQLSQAYFQLKSLNQHADPLLDRATMTLYEQAGGGFSFGTPEEGR